MFRIVSIYTIKAKRQVEKQVTNFVVKLNIVICIVTYFSNYESPRVWSILTKNFQRRCQKYEKLTK